MSIRNIALIGNPNSGKTTIFNALTQQNQRVANWPGMTVEKKTGMLNIKQNKFQIIDLPGCYGLNNNLQIDEKITADYLIHEQPDLIINVINVCKLQQHMYLCSQLLETEIPMIVVLNFMDLLSTKIDAKALEKQLKYPVVAISARKNTGYKELLNQITKVKQATFEPYKLIEQKIAIVKNHLPKEFRKNWLAIQLLESNIEIKELDSKTKKIISQQQLAIADAFDDEPEVIIADLRYNLIQKILNRCLNHEIESKLTKSSYKIDQVLLHPWFGLPIFLAIMYFMFAACLVFGSSLQEPFADSCNLVLVQLPISYLQNSIPNWLTDILNRGAGVAITTTLSFIPPLFLLFSTLSILEQSGYMARAAFITDRLMSLIKLPGRAFVSLLIGFGCNVPAIMSTRTLQNQEDRILTAMMTPFMSCTARLALYVVLVQAFFKDNGSQVIFAIYLTGIIAAILTGMILKQFILTGESQPLLLELPDYLRPSIKQTLTESYRRIKRFISRTFKFMLVACCILATLDSIHYHENLSILAEFAQKTTFILEPMGISSDSWPTTIALIMGTIAKEVMIGIFHTLGHTKSHIAHVSLGSIPSKLELIWHSWWHDQNNEVLTTTVANIKKLFNSQNSVIAFLIFSCLYLPCFSTLAALKKECGRRWGIIASVWSFLLAYSSATLYYQWANFKVAPIKTLVITSIVLIVISIFLLLLKRQSFKIKL